MSEKVGQKVPKASVEDLFNADKWYIGQYKDFTDLVVELTVLEAHHYIQILNIDEKQKIVTIRELDRDLEENLSGHRAMFDVIYDENTKKAYLKEYFFPPSQQLLDEFRLKARRYHNEG